MSTNSRPELPPKQNIGPARSLAAALCGVGTALMRERNLRIQTAAGAAVFFAAGFYDLTRAERLLLLVLVGLVLCCEMLNTAIEHAVDLHGPRRHPLARAAKDIAAGAVLVSALVSAAAGILLFREPEGLAALLMHLRTHPLAWIGGLALAAVWVILPGLLARKRT